MEDFNIDDLLNDDLFGDTPKQEKKPTQAKAQEEKVEVVETQKPIEQPTQKVEVVEDIKIDSVSGEVVEEKPTLKKPTPKVEKKVEPKVEAKPSEEPKRQPKQNAVVAHTPTYAITEDITKQIKSMVTLNNETWTPKEQAVAANIISVTDKVVRAGGYSWKNIDMIGNDVAGAIKHWAKLGIDGYDYLHPMIRNNPNTGKLDLTFEPQYQTFQKLITKYCTKKIFNFVADVICIGDELDYKFDYKLGKDVFNDFKPNPKRNPNDMNQIIGAFAIAFYQEDGEVKQIVEKIDKDTIMQAYNAAKTHKIWDSYTEKMVKKTAIRCLFKGDKIRPFMQYPDEIVSDLGIIDEESDVDFSNKDRKYKDIIEAETVANDFGNGDNLDI